MALYRLDPYRSILTLQNRVNGIFQDLAKETNEPEQVAETGFVPPVDIFEDEHRLVLKLEIPGVRQEDLDVRIENNTLTVRGQRSFQSEGKKENFHRVERLYGSFYRAFTVPSSINPESIKADYEAGVLRLELQKRAELKPKQIKVNVGSGKELHAAPKEAETAPSIA